MKKAPAKTKRKRAGTRVGNLPGSVRKALAKRTLPNGHFTLTEGEEIITGVMLAKYEQFVFGVIEHGDLTKASIDAGMLAPTPGAQRVLAHRLMNIPLIQERLREHYKSVLAKAGANAERVWAELTRLAFSDIGDCGDANGNIKALSDIPENTRRAIVSYKIKRTIVSSDTGSTDTEEREVKLAPKDGSIEKLMRLLGMIKDEHVLVSAEELIEAMNRGRQRALEHSGK